MIQSVVKDVGDRVLGSAVWLGVGRIITRSSHFVRLAVLGRILGPDVYGSFGVAALTISCVETYTEQGLGQALIQRRTDVERFLATVWTANILRGILIFCVLQLGAPLIASGFNAPESERLIQVMALGPFIRGFENLAKVILTRELVFGPQVAVQSVAAVLSTVVGVVSAVAGMQEWSLVAGSLTMAISLVVGSFFIMPTFHRFRFDFKEFKELQRFGVWYTMSRIITTTLTRGGEIVVGYFLPTKVLAHYQMADNIASLPTMEVSRVANTIAFPAFSRLQDSATQLRVSFENALFLVASFTLGVVALLGSCSDIIVVAALGPKWSECSWMMPFLAIWGASRATGSCISSVLLAKNRPRSATVYHASMLLMFLATVYPVVQAFGAVGVAVLLAMIGFFAQAFRLQLAATLVGSRTIDLLVRVAVPSGCAATTALLIITVRSFVPLGTPLVSLIAWVIACLLTYTFLMYLMLRLFAINTEIFYRVIGGIWARATKNVRRSSKESGREWEGS